MADLHLETSAYYFDVRTAGILIRDGKILLQRDRNASEYALPGGHVKLGETSEVCLQREYKEETGADIQCKRLIWTEECFFQWNGKKVHNLSFYYLIDLCAGSAIPDEHRFLPHKDNDNVVIGWLPLENLKDITIYPSFLKSQIRYLDAPLAHFITTD